MIYIYDKSISGCCNQREAVRRVIQSLHGQAHRRRHTQGYHGVRGNATLVYTDDETIRAEYEAAGVPVSAIGPNRYTRKKKPAAEVAQPE